MKYADLKNCMTEYRAGTIEREDMVAAIALWQRPVDITKEILKKAEKRYNALIDRGSYVTREEVDQTTNSLRIASNRARAAVEAVIR